MNSFVNYIIESGISLGALFLVYFAFLRKETFFKANRIFLLFSVVFSSILPLLHIGIFQNNSSLSASGTGSLSTNMLESVTVFSSGISTSLAGFITASNLIVYGYLAVTFAFVLLFVCRIVKIVIAIRRSEVTDKEGIKFVYTDEDSSPYSFLNYLFVSRNLEKNPGWEKMLAHELEHIRQGHSADILILELISIFQWFNPFFWMIKKAIKKNHEYMADRAVLNKGFSVDLYRHILVNQYVGYQLSITNSFNSSLIKSRLKMMTKIKSSKWAGLRFLVGGIMAMALLVVFACENKKSATLESKTEIQKKDSVTQLNTGVNPLIIIDGEIASREVFEKLNPDDIKGVFVSKEKDANTKKFGDKAKDGVIIISTKSDDSEKTEKAEIAYTPDKSIKNGENGIYFIVEKMPEFPGGESALRQFIAQNVKYPEVAKEKGLQGKVYVNFVVEKDGSVGRVKIARGIDPSLDTEALRVTKELPVWQPGKQKGVAVPVSYTIPINFVLQ